MAADSATSVFSKNILVFCDGTGQDGLITEESPIDKDASHFTNVLRLSRAMSPTFTRKKEGQKPQTVSQIVFYQSGVGVPSDFNATSAPSDTAKQAFGTAVASKIRDAYAFIAQNYREGDEISLFGFSRGAYTARKISGLIDRLGLLSPDDMGKFFTYWQQLNGKLSGEPPRPPVPVPIKCLVVWDTVGSVRNGIFEMMDALTLHDDILASNVENAYHAISYHENRQKFMCTLFGAAKESQNLKQVWFSGAHSDVGGGYAEMELADITLAWVVGEIEDKVGINTEFITKSLSNNHNKPKWGESKPHNAFFESGLTAPIVGYKGRMSLIEKASIIHPSLSLAPGAFGMSTIPDLQKKLGTKDLQPFTCKLNNFEKGVQKFWHDTFRDGEVKLPKFESEEDMKGLVE